MKYTVYTVYTVGGEIDGTVIGTFETESEAIKFARDFVKENVFDDLCGGVAIEDESGNVVIDW